MATKDSTGTTRDMSTADELEEVTPNDQVSRAAIRLLALAEGMQCIADVGECSKDPAEHFGSIWGLAGIVRDTAQSILDTVHCGA